mgnify:FL=1
MKFTAKDIIALISIVGLFGLLFIGYNGWVQASITTIIAYYFFRARARE